MTTNEPVDVVIIGAGASGAAFAWSIAETKMRVLCLEQGTWPQQADFPSNGRDWEARQAEDYAISPNRRGLAADYPINDDNSPIKIANFNGVGGGTVLYAGHFPRLHPSDFRVKSLDGVADDWPIDYATLEPFYALNDRKMGIASLAGDPAYPPKESVMPPIPMGKTGVKIGTAMNTLGWHWWPSDAAITTEDYEGRAPCINLNHCGAGCAQGAKASTDVTYWPEAVRARVELRTNCRVSRIETNAEGMATGVTYFDGNGEKVFQPAEIVVMACNGIGTPRILLNSASERFPNGLANSSGLVGKNLMFHPYAQIRGHFDEPLDGYRGPIISLWSMQFYETDPARDFVRGYCYQFSRGLGPVATATNGMADGLIPWGEGHHAAFRRLFERSAGMAAICEDLPEEENRVTLDPQLKDANGIPAPKIEYRLSENTSRMLDHAIARGRDILDDGRRPRHHRQGAALLCRLAPDGHGAHGHRSAALGGQRMGAQPRREEPVHHRWQRLRDRRRRQPDIDHPGDRALRRRPDQDPHLRAVRLRPMNTSPDQSSATLSEAETETLRCVVDLVIPASAEDGLPGAGDPAIFADIAASTGRYTGDLAQALQMIDTAAGGRLAALPRDRQAAVLAAFRSEQPDLATVIGAVTARCYYRDARVMRAIGMEVRPPFPLGFVIEQGDFSLLEPVRARGKAYRDTASGSDRQ